MQQIKKGIAQLTEEANRSVESISIEEAMQFHQREGYIFVDLREAQERQASGIIPGAFTCPRGMLEFLIDPQCPAHNQVFDQDCTYIFYCARGVRSLYAAKLAQEMGLSPVLNMTGGIAQWIEKQGDLECSH